MVIDGYHFSGSVIKAGREGSKEDGKQGRESI